MSANDERARQIGERAANVTAHMLIKFGADEHLAKLLNAGVLFMRRANHFRDLEADGRVRADPWEGYDYIGQPTRGKLVLRLPDGRVLEPNLAGPVLMNRGWFPIPHIFCMTVITDEHASCAHSRAERLLNPRLREFGDHAVVVLDVPALLQRIEQACEREGLQCEYGVVQYMSADHHGEVDYFTKHADFEWQNEFRVAVVGCEDEELQLRLGTLKDIAIVCNAQVVLDTVEYVPATPT